MVCEIGGSSRTEVVFWDAASRICSKQHLAFLSSFHPSFSPCVSFAPKECIYTVVVTQPRLRRNLVLSYQRDQISIWSIAYQLQFMAYADIAFSRWDIAAELCELVYKFQRLAPYSGDVCFLFKTWTVLLVFTQRPMTPVLCSKLRNKVSAWPGIFVKSAKSSA